MSQPRAVLHCNAGGRFGLGHLMRVLAVAEEAVQRGWKVTIVGDLDDRAMGAAHAQCPEVECVVVPLDSVPQWLAESMDPDTAVLHLDTYWLAGADVPAGSFLVSSMQDGAFGRRPADLAIDANLGAERRWGDPDTNPASRVGQQWLLGIDAVAIRRQVRRQRWHRGEARTADRTARVLVVLGGTDPHGATAQVLAALGAVPGPLEVTVVVPASQREAVAAVALSSPHQVHTVPFLDDLPAVACRHDVVVTAAGTSVWDFACMGIPMALVCVADNQVVGYQAAVEAGLGIGLGEPSDGMAESMAALTALLCDGEAQVALSERGRSLVDGLGTWRIVSAWEQLGEVAPRREADRFVARPATVDDARTLYEWRNDPTTRASSRSTDEISWESHLAWVQATILRPDRHLLVVEYDGTAIGTVRWDDEGDLTWEVSITVAPQARGGGRALGVLQAGEQALAVPSPVKLLATVRADNAGSRRLFERAGYLPNTPANDGDFLTYARWRVE